MCMCSCSYSCSCVSIYPSIHPSIYLSICLSICQPENAKLFCEISSVFEVDNMKNAAKLRDFLKLELDTIKNKTSLRDSLNFRSWQHQKRSNSTYQCVLRFFHLSKVLHLSRKIILANLKIWCSKMQPLRKSARWPHNISDEHVSCTAPATRNSTLQILFKSPHACQRFWNCYKILRFFMVLSTFGRVQNPWRLPHKIMQRLKMVLAWPVVFLAFSCIFTLTCALRHSGVHCFISTSKSAPKLRCFLHLDFGKCRALFWHLNFQKCSENGALCTFWLPHLLRATTACTFSTSQLRKVVRTRGVSNVLTSKFASRHNGVQFFICHLTRWLRAHRFSEPTFRPSGATKHWKNTVFPDFLPFRVPSSSFFWLFLFSDLLFSLSLLWLFPPLLFYLSVLLEVWLPKLPSVNITILTIQLLGHHHDYGNLHFRIVTVQQTKMMNVKKQSSIIFPGKPLVSQITGVPPNHLFIDGYFPS